MCNLYGHRVRRWEYNAYFQAEEDFRDELERGELEKDYVSPGRPGWVVREEGGQRGIDMMRWGWPNPRDPKRPVVNVRNYDSPFWRSSLTNPERRCIVPFGWFEEWSVEPDPVTKRKAKHRFRMAGQDVAGFAGVWRPCEGGAVYAFLTCGYEGDPGHHLVGRIHPKAIPVILHREDHDRWLQAPIADALQLACAYPSQLMAMHD